MGLPKGTSEKNLQVGLAGFFYDNKSFYVIVLNSGSPFYKFF